MDILTTYTEQPAISIIIPARNEEAYIAACISSVQAQQHLGAEVIVVDNGSEDRTAALAAALGARVVSEPIPGLPRAREAGRRAARGEILVYLDADTIIPPGYLRYVLSIFSCPTVLAASTAFRFYDGTWLMNGLIAVSFAFYKVLHTVKMTRTLFGGSFAVRQSAMEQIGGFNLALDFYGEDIELSLRLARFGEIAFLDRMQSHTSARRYVRQGVARTCGIYLWNHLLMLCGNRSYTPMRRMLLPQVRGSLLALLLVGVSFFKKS